RVELHAVEADLRGLLQHGPRELLGLVVMRRDGPDLVLRELVSPLLGGDLVLGELELHGGPPAEDSEPPGGGTYFTVGYSPVVYRPCPEPKPSTRRAAGCGGRSARPSSWTSLAARSARGASTASRW